MASRVDRFLNVRYSDLWQVRNDKAKRQLLKEHFFTLIWQYRGNKIVILQPTFPRLKFYWHSKRTLAKVSTETWNGLNHLKPPDHVYYRWPRSTYRPTIDRYIGRLSVDYRSAIDRLSVDSRPIVDRQSTDSRPIYRPIVDQCITRYVHIYRSTIGRQSTDYRSIVDR